MMQLATTLFFTHFNSTQHQRLLPCAVIQKKDQEVRAKVLLHSSMRLQAVAQPLKKEGVM